MIIGISGKIGSGKDTIASIIQYLSSDGYKNFGSKYSYASFLIDRNIISHPDAYSKDDWQVNKFAEKLKRIICLLIGCKREDLESEEFKNSYLGEEWNLNEERRTVRWMLQTLGTQALREVIHPDVHVNALFADYKISKVNNFGSIKGDTSLHYPNWLITDVRFPNEAQAIKDRGGILIRVERNPMEVIIGNTKYIRENDNHHKYNVNGRMKFESLDAKEVLSAYYQDSHPSETALDNYQDWDYVLDNNGSLEVLIGKISYIYSKLTQ